MIEQLREELEVDEGCVKKIYLDHLGYKSCAIGHLVKEGEPEWHLKVGDPVSDERVAELFQKDIAWTIADCLKIFENFNDFPEEVKLICANMVFNMGLNRMRGFRKFIGATQNEDWSTAADEMLDSKWARQLPERSGRLISRMRNV